MSLVQRPDLTHRLQQYLGVRQLQVLPRLLDGIQAVVIYGDCREESREKVVERPCAGFTGLFQGLDVPECYLRNPVNSGVVIRTQLLAFTSTEIYLELIAKTTDGAQVGITEFRDAPSATAITGQLPAGRVSADEVPSLDAQVPFFVGGLTTARHPSPSGFGSPSPTTGWVIYPGMALRGSIGPASAPLGMSALWTECALRP